MDIQWQDIDDPLERARDAIAAAPESERGAHLVDLARLHLEVRGRPTRWAAEDWGALCIATLDVATLVERMAFVDTIAEVGRMPIDLVFRLLADDVLVRRRLVESVRFDDDELLALIDREPSERMLLFVARLLGIGEPVTDRVVELGTPKVHLTLARNGTARLTFPSFDRFSKMTRAQDVMDQALSRRDDLPYEIAKALHQRLSERAARRLAEMIARDMMRGRRPFVL